MTSTENCKDLQTEDHSKVIILSRIDHVNTHHNESKNSELELEMLLNMST